MDITKVSYKHTDVPYTAAKWLNSLPDLFAADFEAANKLTVPEITLMGVRGQDSLADTQRINADGLSHPKLTRITHLSVAWSDRDAYVIIVNSRTMENLIYRFLTTTNSCQLWHNGTFDFKHMAYNTGKIPKSFEDTQQMSKALLNHVDVWNANTTLKHLMGYKYGAWSVAKELEFTLENMYNPKMLEYAAIDACACYALYEHLMKFINKE